jgi:hypothetical protein
MMRPDDCVLVNGYLWTVGDDYLQHAYVEHIDTGLIYDRV